MCRPVLAASMCCRRYAPLLAPAAGLACSSTPPDIEAFLEQYRDRRLRCRARRRSMSVQEGDQPRSVNTTAKYITALRCLVGFAAAEGQLSRWMPRKTTLASGRSRC